MPDLNLFPPDRIVGVFRGFSQGGLEFHANLVLPYRNDFQNIPMHGQFLLVQLETPFEGVLGRITSLHSAGKLSSGTGEEYNLRALREGRAVPEDLREQYLKYEIDIRVLGVLRRDLGGNSLTFVASHRRLPHVGSPVAFLSDTVLQEIAGHNVKGAAIGHFALGEYIYAGNGNSLDQQEWMQIKDPEVLVRFPIENLVARRSFIFARAGFGKSNLNKLLFSTLYRETPTVAKRGGRRVPVGTVLFDPDGEYFWPDDKGRPGLCDVPELQDKLVVFTNRRGPSPFYQSFVAGGIKLDIRRLRPNDVISIAISPDRQEQQNVRKLRALNDSDWVKLVDLIDLKGGNNAPLTEIQHILGLEPSQEAEALAARSNMTSIVRMLHDRYSRLMDMLLAALKNGKLCIVDVSQMRGSQSMILSSLILRRIFDHNQEQFTAAFPETIPTLAVVEEAQAVLNERAVGAEPYIAWVKEGRKYDLGAVLITQQPGSIPNEILSQGDNWFIFHLLSAGDLHNIQGANAHFSQDILSALLNEPIPGQGVFWSSSSGKPYPVALRVLSFERMARPQDPEYTRAAVNTYAQELKERFTLSEAPAGLFSENGDSTPHPSLDNGESLPVDPFAVYRALAIRAVQNNNQLQTYLEGNGAAWGYIKKVIRDTIPTDVDGADDLAYDLVRPVLDEVLGERDVHWETYQRESPRGTTTYVRRK
jgi:DNA helicase HerA-like ATPase